mgnify:CR=1 FL=1|jgi:DNA-binding GntR family transcriptional regulator
MNVRAEGAGPPAHEVVYRRLREMVLFGELEPGQAVTIQGLVDELQAGMTPVREALRRLIAEGALAFRGNRRIVVPVLDAAAVDQLTVARVALEPQLARRAAQHCGPAEVALLRATDARLDRAIARGDVRGYLEENHRFHAELNALAQAPILTELVDGLWLRFGPSLRVVCGQFGTRNLPDRHKDLLEALAEADPDAAARAMEGDVVQGMTQIREGLI